MMCSSIGGSSPFSPESVLDFSLLLLLFTGEDSFVDFSLPFAVIAVDPSVDFLALAQTSEQNRFFLRFFLISCLPQCSHATMSDGEGSDVDEVTFGVDDPLDSPPLTFAASAFPSSPAALFDFFDGSSFSFSE